MASGFPMMVGSIVGLVTSKTMPMMGSSISHMRAPTDPYYLAPVYVKNMVVGSRWMLGYDNAGTFTELDSGTAASTDFTIPGVAAYGAPFLIELRVRNASSVTKYKPGNFFTYHNADGATIFVSQVLSKVS